MAEMTAEEFDNMGPTHPHRLLSRIYAAMCRPQMSFNPDYVGEYTKVLKWINEFVEIHPDVEEMLDIQEAFTKFCEKEYNIVL